MFVKIQFFAALGSWVLVFEKLHPKSGQKTQYETFIIDYCMNSTIKKLIISIIIKYNKNNN